MKYLSIYFILLSIISSSTLFASSGYAADEVNTFTAATDQRYTLSTVCELFIPRYFQPDGNNVDIMFHMHGAYSTVEPNFIKAGINGILIDVTLNGLSGVYQSYFSNSTIFRSIINQALDKLKQLGYATNPQVRFLCISAWSAGYGGVRDVINSSEYANVNALCMQDCPYAGYYPSAPTVSSTDMTPFLKFAKDAVLGSKTYFMSHSEIIPGTYASTSETAEYLLVNVGTTRQPYSGTNAYGMVYISKNEWNRFYIQGFAGDQAQDHDNHLYANYLFFAYIPFPSFAGLPHFPYTDGFPATGRQLFWWVDKFTSPTITAFSPASPGGDGYVLVVKDPSGGYESTRIGNATDSDYFVAADIYCQYRPDVASDGFERYGIFARDSGNGGFEGTTGGGGFCYFMAYDSNNGRLWCGKSVNGVLTDFNSTPQYLPSTNWRNFRIECLGNHITYKLDNTPILTVTDNTYHSGPCGIGFHEYFTANNNMLGTRVDNFSAAAIRASAVSHWMLYQ